MASHDEELVASKTEGFKVGEKKTVEEYAKLGQCAGSAVMCKLVDHPTLTAPSLTPRQIRRMKPSIDGKHRLVSAARLLYPSILRTSAVA